jgi:hypothetical protein
MATPCHTPMFPLSTSQGLVLLQERLLATHRRILAGKRDPPQSHTRNGWQVLRRKAWGVLRGRRRSQGARPAGGPPLKRPFQGYMAGPGDTLGRVHIHSLPYAHGQDVFHIRRVVGHIRGDGDNRDRARKSKTHIVGPHDQDEMAGRFDRILPRGSFCATGKSGYVKDGTEMDKCIGVHRGVSKGV